MSIPPWRAKKTAYTPVAAGRTFTPGQSSRAPATTAPSNSNQEWPDSLKRFVARCFEEGKSVDNAKLQEELRQVITKAFEEKTTWAIDWDVITLPIIDASKKKKRRPLNIAPSIVNPPKNSFDANSLQETDERLIKRQRRFELRDTKSSSTPPIEIDINEPLIGRSTKLEKRYLRLTSAPDPDSVRPLAVLKQTLDLLKRKWREEQNYAYICDQFKSLRQDLTVQHIQNEFTVSVYEIHARIALEKGDLGEYNQCQSQLNQLYAKGIPGKREEFLSYRILYLCHTQNHAEIGSLITQTDPIVMHHTAVKHALKVYAAMLSYNYHVLFKLYLRAPNMSGYVMDSFVTRERLSALVTMCRVYKPHIPLAYVAKELGFREEENESIGECVDFINQFSPIEPGATTLSTKDSFQRFELARQQAYKKVDIKGQI